MIEIIVATVAVSGALSAAALWALVVAAYRQRYASAPEKFYSAWDEHCRGGFEVTQPVADELARRFGLPKAPPLADDTDEFLGIVPQSQLREGPDGKAKPWERMVAILDDAGLGNSVGDTIKYLESIDKR